MFARSEPSELAYPDYTTIVKQDFKDITVPKAGFENLLRQANAITDAGFFGAVFKFNGGITVSAVHPEKGEFENRSVIPYQGPDQDCEVILNIGYLLDAIRPFAETVRIGLKETGVVRFGGDSDFSAYVMRMSMGKEGEHEAE